ncbi:MAG: SDR family NAD(P)-dependent oxidoreductase [Candidatus Eremiobacteraeota bacterium]|nr:SDR family NAD(P)-dependent oxidoreductase [Candidatus Eremiobacteraeota bacterium]
MKLAGSLAVVSGASSGIGEATARALAGKGARVALLARSREALDRIAREITEAGGQAIALAVDLSDPAAAQRAAQRVLDELGTPDVLINSAGAGRWLYTEETTPQEAVDMMALPYFAAFYLTRAFLPGMLERRSGRIVNIGSPAAFAPWPGATAYAAARWALRGLSEALRADLRGTGIGVTLFTAGAVSSGYWEHNAGTAQRMPGIGRLFRTLTPAQAADAIVRAIERGQSNVVVPFSLRAVMALHRIWPWPVQRLLISTGYRRPTEKASRS